MENRIAAIAWGFVTLLMVAPGRAGEVKILTMTKGLQAVDGDESDVRIIRLGEFDERPAYKDMDLDDGDEIRCLSGDTTVVLTTALGTTASLTDRFRAIIVSSPDPNISFCVNLLKGTTDVDAQEETEMTGGFVTAGSKHTRYAMQVGRTAAGPLTEVAVYKDSVALRFADAETRIVKAGKKTICMTQPQELDLQPQDFDRAALVYGRVETAMSPAAARALEPVRAQICQELTNSYKQVLEQPKNWAGYKDLATAQLRFELPSRAKYTLKQANPKAPKDAANIELLRGITSSLLGDPATARRYYEAAKQKDAAVDNVQNLQVMRINPIIVRELRAPRLPVIDVACRVRPVRDQDQITLLVHAGTAQGEPVADATVTIVGAGGSFVAPAAARVRAPAAARVSTPEAARVRAPEVARVNGPEATRISRTEAVRISGRTDARGNFTARWRYTVRARRPVFKIEVAKQGFLTTITDSTSAAARPVPALDGASDAAPGTKERPARPATTGPVVEPRVPAAPGPSSTVPRRR